MKLISGHLVGFCQHRDVFIEFAPGTTCVLGPNGVGKSNLLLGIKYALTGESDNYGGKAENLTWGIDPSGAKVEVVFEVGGRRGTIRRSVDKATCNLNFDDGELKKRSAAGVAEVIFDILDVAPSILNDIIFVKQGQIERILFSKSAERKKSFQRLCGLEGVEKRRVFIAEELDKLVVSDYTVQLAGADARIDQLTHDGQRLVSERSSLEVRALELVPKVEGSTLAQEAAAAKAALEELVRLRTRMQAVSAQKSAAATTSQENSKALDGISAALTLAKPLVDTYRAKVAAADADPSEATRKQLDSSISEHQELLGTTQPPVQPDEPSLEQLRAEEEDLSNGLAISGTFAELPEQELNNCPFCGSGLQPEAGLALIRHHKMVVGTTTPKLEHIRASIKLQEDYSRGYAEYVTWLQTMNTSIRGMQETLSSLPQRIDLGDVDAMRKDISVFDAMDQTASRLRSELTSAEMQFTTLDEEGQSLASFIETQAAIVAMSPNAEAVVAAQRDAHDLAELNRSIAELSGSISSKEQELENLKSQTEDLRALQGQASAVLDYREFLTDSRNILHRDSFPRLVVANRLEALNDTMVDYLKLFDSPFSGYIDDELNVICVSSDGVHFSAERLSGGQKVAMALSFRMALNRMFSKVGLVVLDEPTAYLDKDRIDCVVRLLDILRNSPMEKETQFLISTHHPAISAVADKVIELELPDYAVETAE